MARAIRKADETFTVSEAELFEDGDPEVSYTIRPITRDRYQSVSVRLASKFGGRRAMKLSEQFEFMVAMNEELFDYALVDWSGVTMGGEPAVCDAETKKLLDGVVMQKVLDKAGLNDIRAGEAARAATFR